MVYTTNVGENLREGNDATNDKIDDFFIFVAHLKMEEKKQYYEAYRVWTKLLRHRRTPHKNMEGLIFSMI